MPGCNTYLQSTSGARGTTNYLALRATSRVPLVRLHKNIVQGQDENNMEVILLNVLILFGRVPMT